MGVLFIIVFRTIFMYLLVLLIFRLMGKREIGELSLLDLIVFIMIAEMAVISIESPKSKLTEAILPMLILMLIQIGFSQLSLRSRWFRVLIDGKPSIIIYNGKIDERVMRKQRYNFDDLLSQLREKDIFNINEVEFAILESSGKLSVMKKQSPSDKTPNFPLPLILDGEVQRENLEFLQLDEQWLLDELKSRGFSDVGNISYCTFENGTFTIDEKDEEYKP